MVGQRDGNNLYVAYFVPNKLDPSGLCVKAGDPCDPEGKTTQGCREVVRHWIEWTEDTGKGTVARRSVSASFWYYRPMRTVAIPQLKCTKVCSRLMWLGNKPPKIIEESLTLQPLQDEEGIGGQVEPPEGNTPDPTRTGNIGSGRYLDWSGLPPIGRD